MPIVILVVLNTKSMSMVLPQIVFKGDLKI
jgi:hypothetical protein